MHKDFKYLDISTGPLYFTESIVLDEKLFPFASLGSNAGAQYTSEVLLLPEPQTGNNTSTNTDDSPACFPLPMFSSCVQQQEDNTESRLAPWAADTCPAHSTAPDVHSAPCLERASADVRPAPDAPAHILPGVPSTPSTTQDDSSPPSVVPAAIESAPVLHLTPDVSSSAPGVSPERRPVHDVPGSSSTASAQPRRQPSALSPEILPHRTRLHGGIRKPKAFTDGTVAMVIL
jgi:hypothetical protein